MTNKKKLVKAINKDFDKQNNYSLILEKIENTSTHHLNFRYILAPVCLILLFLVITSSKSTNNFHEKKYNINNYAVINEDIIILNTAKKNDVTYSDKEINSNKENGQYIPYFDFEDNLKLPEDIDNKNYKEVISQNSEVQDKKEDNDDNHYIFHYFNTKNQRYIVIAFHKKNGNMDTTLSSNNDDKISRINGITMYIYKYENKYIARFEYDKLSFNVSSTDLNEKEFIDLLKSIVR